jgi:hypothetical protein
MSSTAPFAFADQLSLASMRPGAPTLVTTLDPNVEQVPLDCFLQVCEEQIMKRTLHAGDMPTYLGDVLRSA